MSKKHLKSDKSPSVPQRDKIRDKFVIKEKFQLTEKQQKVLETIADKGVTMTILDGVTGSSKTYLAVLAGLKLLNEKKCSDIVYIRSLIQAKDGETGFLSGDLAEKTFFYNVPLYDKLTELLDKSDADKLAKDARIKTYPTAMLRGYNFSAQVLIIDEAQNISFDSLITAITRVGNFTRVIVLGDTRGQNDYGSRSGFQKFCDIFSDAESSQNGVRYFRLDAVDVVRSPFVKFVVNKLNAVANQAGK